MNSKLIWTVAVAVAVALAAGGLWWWRHQATLPPPAPPAAEPPPLIPEPAAPPAPAEPAIRHPLEPTAEEAAPLPALAQSDGYVTDALADLLTRKTVRGFLITDDFVRRAVATVDNLGRASAPARLWPVQPAPQRFAVAAGERIHIDAGNAARYAPFVRLVESIDAARAVALYRKLYPLFQQAYEELGYPRGYFNDRLIQVIDLMLATPRPAEPVEVVLTEVKGPIESSRPWTRYEYADPMLEASPAGQKILMRMGHDNAQRVQAKLAEIRKLIAREAPTGAN